MLAFLPAPIRGTIVLLLLISNIMIIPLLVIFFGLIKYILPISSWKSFCEKVQSNHLTSLWIDINNFIISIFTKIEWEIKGEGQLHPNNWYFVVANHQSWADIIIIQKVFNRKIPLLKFFLKQQLLWALPMGGLACWMLDFPFIKRFSKDYLKKHPEMKNKDIETIKQACLKFKSKPTAVMNFLEGTRYTRKKQETRSSPYKHLLRPKVGGLALVISQLKDYIHEVINVTIIYCHPNPSFWNYICGRIPKIIVHYEILPIPSNLFDHHNAPQFRRDFQNWVNKYWQQKDQRINSVLTASPAED